MRTTQPQGAMNLTSTGRVFGPPALMCTVLLLIVSGNERCVQAFYQVIIFLHLDFIPSVKAFDLVAHNPKYAQVVIGYAWLIAIGNSIFILARSSRLQRNGVLTKTSSFNRSQKLVVIFIIPLIFAALLFLQVDAALLEPSRGLLRERVLQEMVKLGVLFHLTISLAAGLATAILVFLGSLITNYFDQEKK